MLARDVGRAVGRAVVDDDHVHVRQLAPQVVEHRRQVLLLVPGRDEDDGVAHVASAGAGLGDRVGERPPWSDSRHPESSACTAAAPTIGPSGTGAPRVEDERLRLRPAEAAVERDQLLEGAALVEQRVVEAVDEDVGHVREAVGAPQVLARVGREARERVLAVDAAVREVVDAARAERDRPVIGGADEHEADVRVLAERGISSGWRSSISSSVSRRGSSSR